MFSDVRDVIWPCILIIMIIKWLFSGILFICSLEVSFTALALRARAANDTTRAQINNIPEKSHFTVLLWGALECDLSWLVLPWGRTSAPLKICPFWQNLPVSNKSFALVFAIVWQNVSRVQHGPITRQLLLCFPELFDKFYVSKNVFALVFCTKWHVNDEIYQLLQNLSPSANWP